MAMHSVWLLLVLLVPSTSAGLFILQLAGLGLLIAKHVVRSKAGCCCKSAFVGMEPFFLFKDFVNRISASER